jgi:hypothetical protein
MRCSGHHQDVAEARVEALGDVAHQLQVLALVLAHRDLVRAVGEHVGGLQDGIEQQPAETSWRCCTDLSRNWCMRLSSPTDVTLDSSQHSSVCSTTSPWRNRMQRAGSSPAARRIAAVS